MTKIVLEKQSNIVQGNTLTRIAENTKWESYDQSYDKSSVKIISTFQNLYCKWDVVEQISGSNIQISTGLVLWGADEN